MRNFEPTDESWYPKCAFHLLTGLHCPGCGTTRALRALALGDLKFAIRNNPLLIIGMPIIVGAISLQYYRESHGGKASPHLSLTVFAVVFIYFIARNFPSPTDSCFAPPAATLPALKVEVDTILTDPSF